MFLLDPLKEYDPTFFRINRVGSNPSGAGSRIQWTEAQNNYIVQCYNQQKSVKLLSQLFSTSEETMRNHLHRLGVSTLSRYEKGLFNRHRDSNFFHVIDTPEKAYWLGFMYADGYVNEDRNFIRINLKADDEAHLKKFLFCLQAIGFPIQQQSKVMDGNIFYQSYINIVDHQLVKDLVDKGCFQIKTFDIKYPDESIVPKCLQSHFIRGLMDADGCITYTTRNNSDLKFFELQFNGTYDLVTGIKHYFNLDHLKITQANNICVLQIGGNVQVYNILTNIYKNSYYEIELDRKRQLYDGLKWQRDNMFGYKKEVLS